MSTSVCSSSAATVLRHSTMMTSSRCRKMAAASSADERWVALNKNTFLDILNTILGQNNIFAAGTTPALGNSRRHDVMKPLEPDDDVMTSCDETTSGLCGGTVSNYVDIQLSNTQPTSKNCTNQKPEVEIRDDDVGESATDLSSTSRTSSDITTSGSHGTSTPGEFPTDDDCNAVEQNVDDAPEVCIVEPAHDVVRSLPRDLLPVTDCAHRKSETGSFNQEVSMTSSGTWMPIDKSLLCDVIDNLLQRDRQFGVARCEQQLPVRSQTGSSFATSTAKTSGDELLRSLLRTDTPPPLSRDVIRPTQIMTSSSQGLRYRRRSSAVNKIKRRTRNNFRSQALPFPGNFPSTIARNFSDSDKMAETGNAAMLKWKSTMLLRMRSQNHHSETSMW